MRYFKTTNASRRYRAGDLAVTFEPVENIGGSWSGLLAVEVDSAASKIVSAQIPQITEITQAEYDDLKKKPSLPNSSFRESARPPQYSPQLPVVGPAGRVVSTSSSNPSPPPPPTIASLKVGRLDVPDELKLETGDKRRK